MVRFIFGGAGSGKSEYVLGRIEETLLHTDRRVCLIVPEQHTVTTERRTAKRYHPSASTRMEVTNFTRLSDSISRIVGGLSYVRRTRGADLLMLWRAVLSVYGSLSELGRAGGDETAIIPTGIQPCVSLPSAVSLLLSCLRRQMPLRSLRQRAPCHAELQILLSSAVPTAALQQVNMPPLRIRS